MKSKILPIRGDASFRKFYRFISKKNKIIITAKREKYKNLVAYLAINRFLRNKKILAPKLYGINFAKGIMVIEDFGDSSFYNLKSNNSVLLSSSNNCVPIGTFKYKFLPLFPLLFLLIPS